MRIGAGLGVVIGDGVAARETGPRARGPLARGICSRATGDNSSGLRRPRLLLELRVGSIVVVRAIGTNSRPRRRDSKRASPRSVDPSSLSLQALRKAVVAATAGARRSEIIIIGAAVLIVAHLCDEA